MHEVERLSNIKESRMTVVELNNNKIYRIHSRDDDTNNTVSLRNIYRRTNELTVYECFDKIQELPIAPKRVGVKDNVILRCIY
jgi:alpha-D-ribose 1-methylphosphonate 5-phosphate C-P lyase